MWPNTNRHKAYGTMVCVLTTDSDHLTVGKRYDILDLDPVAIGPGEAEFAYYISDDCGNFTWVTKEYLSDFVANPTKR